VSEDSTHHNTVQLIQAAQAGDRDAEGELWVLLLDEVRRIAHVRLRQEKVGITLQTDDLANEAFLRMVNLRDMAFDSRKHFLAMAARAVRQILVDQARARKADKRGGGAAKQQYSDTRIGASVADQMDVLGLHETLEALGQRSKVQHDIVELRFFGGLTMDQVAAHLDLPLRSCEREFSAAKAWLSSQLHSD
jgi:RNA polymerase sigma factor (TIGR02999 family)